MELVFPALPSWWMVAVQLDVGPLTHRSILSRNCSIAGELSTSVLEAWNMAHFSTDFFQTWKEKSFSLLIPNVFPLNHLIELRDIHWHLPMWCMILCTLWISPLYRTALHWIHSAFIVHPLCTRQCSRHRQHSSEQSIFCKVPAFLALTLHPGGRR